MYRNAAFNLCVKVQVAINCGDDLGHLVPLYEGLPPHEWDEFHAVAYRVRWNGYSRLQNFVSDIQVIRDLGDVIEAA